MDKPASSKGSSQVQGSSQQDQSLIYQILTHKDTIPVSQPLSQPPRQATPRHTTQDPGETDDYGELIEVQALSLGVQESRPTESYQKVEEGSKIKVFIDPNPPAPVRHRIQSNQQSELRPQQQYTTVVQILESNPIPAHYATIPKHSLPNEPPSRKQAPTLQPRKRTQSSFSRKSSQGSETDSFEEYKEFKRRKKAQSMKALVRKMEGLEKKVQKLKEKNKELEEKQEKKRKVEEERKQAQLFSNLISIKVKGQDSLKEDILQELRNIRTKVEVLDNKSTETRPNQTHYQTTRMEPLDNLTPAIAQSKVEANSNTSRSRVKQTGKILKRSQVQPSSGPTQLAEQVLDHIEPKYVEKNVAQRVRESDKSQRKKTEPKIEQPRRKSEGKEEEQQITESIPVPQVKIINVYEQQQEEQLKELVSHSEQRREENAQKSQQRIPRDAISLSRPKQKTEDGESQQFINKMPECRQSPIEEIKPNHRGRSEGGFVRSGGAKIAPISGIDRQASRQEWEESLKLLEFDTGKEKFMIESNPTEDDKQSLLKMRDASSWEQAEVLLPTMPEVAGLASFETDNQELQALGKQLLQKMGAGEIDYDKIGLRVKKYKNCVYFGVDPERNILLHYEGKLYYGGWKEYLNGEGQKSGEGVEISPNKFHYKGHYKEGKRNGLGVLKVQTANGKSAIYVGQFIDGNKHGQGRQFEANGATYNGEWKDNKKDGRGKLILSSYQTYQGTFEKGFKSGYGQETFRNGDRYEGHYLLGKFQGKGKYMWGSGAIYEGQFKAGLRNGWGVWRSQIDGGDIYEGEYVDDKKEGEGSYQWANGAVYKGHFKQDQKHGKGTITHQNGQVSALQWENGEVIKHLDPNQQPHSRPTQPAQPNHLMLTNAKIRNHNKSLPVNKKFLTSREKQHNQFDQKLVAQTAFNKLTLSNASSSAGKPAQAAKTLRHDNRREREVKLERQTERPVTSKSLTSINSNFKLQRRGGSREGTREVAKDGFPVDPPYRGIRPSANMVHF